MALRVGCITYGLHTLMLIMILTKYRSDTIGKTLKIKDNLKQSESKVELLGLIKPNWILKSRSRETIPSACN